MFVIYKPITRRFLKCVIHLDDGPWFEWSERPDPMGFIATEQDALYCATDVIQNEALHIIAPQDIQVLRLLDRNIPDFVNPVLHMPAQRIS